MPAFYALKDARTPMLVSLFSVVVNFVVASFMVRTPLRHAGLALATRPVSVASFLLLLLVLRQKIGSINGTAVHIFLKTSAASAVMASICYVSSGLIHQLLGATHTAAFTDLAISIPLGAAVFFALCKAMGIPGAEANDANGRVPPPPLTSLTSCHPPSPSRHATPPACSSYSPAARHAGHRHIDRAAPRGRRADRITRTPRAPCSNNKLIPLRPHSAMRTHFLVAGKFVVLVKIVFPPFGFSPFAKGTRLRPCIFLGISTPASSSSVGAISRSVTI